MGKINIRVFAPAVVLALSLLIAGCHSHHVDCFIQNRTGAAIHQLEIDYPSASFGVDTLSPGQIYPYKFKVQGNGLLKVQYADSTGKQVKLVGTNLTDGDDGQYLVILLPDGGVKWVPSLNVKN